MYYLIIALMILASVLMCGIVLIQESKGGGLASSFSGGNQTFGVRKTTDFLEKGTWILAGIMVILSIISVGFVPKATSQEEPINVTTPAQQSTDANNVPSFPTSSNSNSQKPAQQQAPAQE